MYRSISMQTRWLLLLSGTDTSGSASRTEPVPFTSYIGLMNLNGMYHDW